MIKWIIPVLLLTITLSLSAQNPDYNNRIHLIYKSTIQDFSIPQSGLYKETNGEKNEKKYSYLWPLCAFMQAANEMEVMEPKKDYLNPVMKAIAQYYNTNAPTPAYQAYVTKEEADTRYYDDNQWIGIAAMDAYNRTKKKSYLDLSKQIYRFMMTGFDTISGGGLYWREGDKTSKNTCSNGPAVLLALQLYKVTHEKGYLDTALLLYNWTNKWLLSPQGVYYDAIKVPSLVIDKPTYTYNTGTMLQSAVLLYSISKNDKYLNEAKKMADAAERHFYVNKQLPGNYWFNAVMLRGFVELYRVEKDKKRLQFFIDDSERIWQQEKDTMNLLGKKDVKSLIDQSAMLEIYARLQLLNK
ncbi:MAG: glycoside hydrolase family 76 protein [Bacteroidota bacterium]|nr:glycoside hydrolase family 76 protein [Bacteroidota bacterium]